MIIMMIIICSRKYVGTQRTIVSDIQMQDTGNIQNTEQGKH